MRSFAVLTILIAVLVGLASRGHRPQAGDPATPVAAMTGDTPPAHAATVPPADAASPGTVRIARGANGHFTVAGSVDGTPLDFIVDTGASQVALGREDAGRVGIWLTDADFTGQAQTAGGTVRVAARTLPRLRIGPIEVRDVPVLVLDVPKVVPLLGQSFLARLDSVAIQGDGMTLTKR